MPSTLKKLKVVSLMLAQRAGPNAKRTPKRFERDVEFIQRELESTAKELGDRGIYIGEWHSHLEIDPEPSGRDVLSLSGIAEASNYATRSPIMLIAGLDQEKKGVSQVKAWSFSIAGRIHPIALDVRGSECEPVPPTSSDEMNSVMSIALALENRAQ